MNPKAPRFESIMRIGLGFRINVAHRRPPKSFFSSLLGETLSWMQGPRMRILPPGRLKSSLRRSLANRLGSGAGREPKAEQGPQDEDGAQQVHSLVITWSQPRRVEARIGADGRPHPSTIRRYPDASEQ